MWRKIATYFCYNENWDGSLSRRQKSNLSQNTQWIQNKKACFFRYFFWGTTKKLEEIYEEIDLFITIAPKLSILDLRRCFWTCKCSMSSMILSGK